MFRIPINYKFIVTVFLCLLMLDVSLSKAQKLFADDSFEGRLVLGSHAIGGTGGVLQDKVYGLDLSYQKDISHLTDHWVKRSNAKSAGIEFIFRDLKYLKGYQDTSANSFGQAYGIAGQMDFELLTSNNFTINLRPAVGLSYLNKTFFTNKKNRFIGSHLNEIIKADLFVQTPLNSKTDFTAGAGFLHYSNGGYHIPNSGINMLSISAGLKFKTPDVEKQPRQTNYSQLNKNTFEINFGIGRRGAYERREGLLKSGIYAGYNLFVNDIFSFKAGFDAVYYYTVFNPAPVRDIETFQYYGTSYDRWRTGFSFGGETNIWRLALNAQIGKYLHYNSYYKDINWYWTTGLVYYLNPHVGLQAKTYFHKSQADFINFGMVFKL